MYGRRLIILVAMLLGVAAVTTSLAPREAARTRTAAGPEGRPAQPELEPRADGAGQVLRSTEDVPNEPYLSELSAQSARQRVEVRAGERVRLAIRSTQLASVQIGRDGPVQAIDPDSPARFDLLYASAARYPISVRDAAGGPPRVIGRLDVVPRS